jgi:hypothetical protein
MNGPTHLVLSRAAKYPPIAEDITATMTRYTPAAALNVPAEIPDPAQGEIEERPSPAPNAKRAKLSAAAVTAPAAIYLPTTLPKEIRTTREHLFE